MLAGLGQAFLPLIFDLQLWLHFNPNEIQSVTCVHYDAILRLYHQSAESCSPSKRLTRTRKHSTEPMITNTIS